MEKRVIYADHAATTRMFDSAAEIMMRYLTADYGNPSSAYSLGRTARRAVETARDQAAQFLGCENREIFFTSGGTESDNWALRGCMEALRKKGKTHLITSSFEHYAVLNTCRDLEQKGFSVTYLSPTSEGYLLPQQVEQAIRPDTGMVSIMYANNEIGTIQPVEEIGAVCRSRGVYFHTDAVQAAGSVPIQVHRQQIDLLSLSAHKIHGPKGAGLLFVRNGVPIKPLIYGGEQQRGFRPGTENVAAIAGFGAALEQTQEHMEENAQTVKALRDELIDRLLQIPGSHLNGAQEPRLCGNVNVSFEGIEGEALLLMMDLHGICVSSGSACTTGNEQPSRVLRQLGLSAQLAKGSVRITLGEENTREEVERIAEACREIVQKLRQMRFGIGK